MFYNEVKRAINVRIPDKKRKNLKFLFNGRENVLNALKGNIFPMKVTIKLRS